MRQCSQHTRNSQLLVFFICIGFKDIFNNLLDQLLTLRYCEIKEFREQPA